MSATESVPVIDASRLGDPGCLCAVDEACREWGFFQVVHHGVDLGLVDQLNASMRAFFALPSTVKRRVERTAENPWGFYDRELTKNTLDLKEVFDVGPAEGDTHVTPWPDEPAGFEAALRSYAASCEGLALRLLRAVSLNLGMSEGRLARDFEPRHTSFLRLNYYPVPVSTSPDQLGIQRHTDAGALTVLLQDEQAGLEVLHAGAWRRVEPMPGALVINIGDIVQVWSNDRYRAPLHRVRASVTTPRFSVPYFYNPSYEARYQPLPSTVTVERPARYRPIQWGEFRSLRASGDYADVGEEVQIDHYRVGDAGGSRPTN